MNASGQVRDSSSSPVQRVLHLLRNVQPTTNGWETLCPSHVDTDPSLSVSEGEDGRVLLHCFAGCETKKIVKALGLTMTDLFPGKRSRGRPAQGEAESDPPGTAETMKLGNGLTLVQYAEAKRLPIDFLRRLGLSEISYQGVPAVRIPYLDEGGAERAVRFRLAQTGSRRFAWKKGSKVMPYGREDLAKARQVGRLIIAEGESDRQTLLLHDFATMSIPGADTWKEDWASLFDGIPRIDVIIEPDQGGEAVLRWLSKSRIRDRVYLVRLHDAKDVSDLYLKSLDSRLFKVRMQAALADAVPWAKWERQQAEAAQQAAWAKCAELATSPAILNHFAIDISRQGLAGEEQAAKLIYLAVTSRFRNRPVSCVITGPSSAGKSYVVQSVLRFFPQSACYVLTSMTERALVYSTEPLAHRMLVLHEAAGISGDFQTYLVRSLLSEGHLIYETVMKMNGQLSAHRIEREGPTGLIMTTAMIKLHTEIETRLLAIPVSDTPEQTKAVLQELTRPHTTPADATLDVLAPWLAFQAWLAEAEHRVVIPYAELLADRILPVAVRLRRDFGVLLALVETHALLHQASRQRDAQDRVVAGIDDYAVVRELVRDRLAEGVEVAVSGIIRTTVNAVAELLGEHADVDKGVTITAVAKALGIEKPAAWRRVRMAIHAGYLTNREERRGRPARLVLDEPLPENVEFLPTAEALETAYGSLLERKYLAQLKARSGQQ